MIPVTKPYLPNRQKLDKYIDGIYEREWLTNNGQLVQELTKRLEDYLGVKNLLLVANGTLALQIAYRALGVSDADRDMKPEAITTPFTFVATASSLKWEGVQPVFTDIDPNTWCLAPDKIEGAITSNTRAIVPVHVFGNACDVEAIEKIASRHDVKVIYDASHAFGVNYKDGSLLRHGDASTLSFHATKLFHTGEGGAIVFKDKRNLDRAKKMINFGITGPETIEDLGINAKMNEFQAAMGLCVLDEINENMRARQEVFNRYEMLLPGALKTQEKSSCIHHNNAYYPVVFKSEKQLIHISEKLKGNGILARRYFYPSLEQVKCLAAHAELPISKKIASRILCLPIYSGLSHGAVSYIVDTIESALREIGGLDD